MKKEVMVPILVVIVSSLLGFGLGYGALQPQIATLDTSLSAAQAQLDLANEADISVSLHDEKLESYDHHSIQGLVINFGSEPAINIVITVKWFKDGTSYHQEIITIPSLDGRAIKQLSFSYAFEGRADDLQYTVTWE